MALWHRINQSKLKFLTHQLSRYYVQTPHNSLSSHIVKTPNSSATASPSWDFCGRSTDLCNNVRFYATSFQAKAKKDEKANGGQLLNEEIIAHSVRLVTDEGHFVVSLREARERARKLGLDLVQVQGSVDPPVCKIMDFKREQYKRKMQEKDRAKEKKEGTLKKGGCKEVRFLEKTEIKDLKMKADSVVRLMERGYRVKCMAVGTPKKGGRAAASLKGSGAQNLTEEEIAEIRRQEEEAEKERLLEVLSRLTALLGDEYVLESGARAEKKQAFVIVRHAKFGLKKGGGGTKKKDVGKVSTSQSGPIGSADMAEEDYVESGAETEDESLSNEDGDNAWSVDNSVDDLDELFEVAAKEPSLNVTQNIPVLPEVKSYSKTFNIPNASQFKPVNDSKQPMRIPLSPQQSFEAENRYKRSEPREPYSPTPPRDGPGLNFKQNIPVLPEVKSPGKSFNIPNVSQFKPVNDSKEAVRVPLSPQQPFEAENRYKRSQPREGYPPTLPRGNSAPDRTGSFGITPPQFSNQIGRQQFPPTPPGGNGAPDRTGSFGITPPQFSNQTGRQQFPPTPPRGNSAPDRTGSFEITPPQFSNQTGKTQLGIKLSPIGERKPVQTSSTTSSLPNAPNTRPSSYGIFSNPKSSPPGKQGAVQSEVNNDTERPKDDGREQPRWGIFSKDSPNVNPNRTSK